MDVNPKNFIKLADDLFAALLDGNKRITIRKGLREYTLGRAVVEATNGTFDPVEIFIDGLSCSMLVDVSDEDAQDDGFEDAADLAAGLRRFYPDLEDDDMVTTVRFSVRATST